MDISKEKDDIYKQALDQIDSITKLIVKEVEN